MIKQALLPFIILMVLASCGAQKNSLTAKDYGPPERVLIIGAGSVVSEIFMENLTENITARLNKKRIESNIVFLKNIKAGTPFDQSSLDSSGYDAYIIFHPLDNSKIVMNRARQVTLYRWVRIKAISPHSYKQNFLVQIYMKADKVKPVWETSLQVDLDPTDKEEYNGISSYILNYLPLY